MVRFPKQCTGENVCRIGLHGDSNLGNSNRFGAASSTSIQQYPTWPSERFESLPTRTTRKHMWPYDLTTPTSNAKHSNQRIAKS